MKNALLKHVFGALQGLEKYNDKISHLAEAHPERTLALSSAPEDQAQMVLYMRKTANKLQMAFARDDWNEGVRLLKIFYGINALVRPEVLSSFVIMSQSDIKQVTQHREASMH